MEKFSCPVQVRWSDLDPNFHLRHSVYYDWGAYCRVEFLYRYGLNADVMAALNIGPILFREECIFRREIRPEDEVAIDLKLLKAKRDYSRWTIQHHIIKNGGETSAILTVDGAWLNLVQRKLATPPAKAFEVFDAMPKAEGFEWLN